MTPFHIREWLNPISIYASSSITAFHGMNSYLGEDNKRTDFEDKQLKIHDCQHSIRLHQMSDETDEMYIAKIRLVAGVCTKFANHLEAALEQKAC